MIKIKQFKYKDYPSARKIIFSAFFESDTAVADYAIKRNLLDQKINKNALVKPRDKYWVILLNKKIIGLIGLESFSNDICYLGWFGIEKEYQNKGFGTKLFLHALKEAKKEGKKIMYIEGGSDAKFEIVNNFYKKNGFKKLFGTKDYWSKNDDLILFYKTIKENEPKKRSKSIVPKISIN